MNMAKLTIPFTAALKNILMLYKELLNILLTHKVNKIHMDDTCRQQYPHLESVIITTN
jgi:hypothetical protein